MTKRAPNQFITIPNGKFHGVFEIKERREYVPSQNADGGNLCPCCAKPMIAAFDLMQLGFWDDSYETYFVCQSCEHAVVYVYSLSCIEPVKAKRGKKQAKVADNA